MCYVFSVIVFETGHGGRRPIVVLSVLRYTALLLKGRFLRKISCSFKYIFPPAENDSGVTVLKTFI